MNLGLCASEIWGAVEIGAGRPLSAFTPKESISYLKVNRWLVDVNEERLIATIAYIRIVLHSSIGFDIGQDFSHLVLQTDARDQKLSNSHEYHG